MFYKKPSQREHSSDVILHFHKVKDLAAINSKIIVKKSMQQRWRYLVFLFVRRVKL